MSQISQTPAQLPTINTPVIFEQEGALYTNSLSVATCFEKRHDHVVRDIRALIAECPSKFGLPNFGESSYTNSQGKEQPLYNLTFDGFILLAMGYTGPKALQVKLAYIEAFNSMKAELESRRPIASDTTLSPSDQNIIQALVKAIADRYPEAEQKSVYMQVWMRFRNHFRLGSYKDLPGDKMAEAVAYLANLKVNEKGSQKKLPPAYTPLAEAGREAMAHIMDLRRDLFKVSCEVNEALSRAVYHNNLPGTFPENLNQLSEPLNKAAGAFFMAINHNLIAVEEMFRAFCAAEKMIFA